LATFWLTKSLVCIDAFIKDSTIQSDVRRFCTAYKSEDFGSLSAIRTTCHPVRTPICPLFHPSRRRTIPSGRPNRPSIIRPDDVNSVRTPHCIEKFLFQFASVRTSRQPVRTPLSIRSSFRFFPSSFIGRLIQLSGRRRFPSGCASP